ncbi:phospho-sugar mutase [Ferrimonas senticii]|uniref:phospho-sugar mutase n=1 Tax=Ferrimonas senticii TaxID=394566 RepID=UPI0003F4DAEF|nr:phospho-sugar mutase [Ferrimonas senticii]
MESMLLRWLQQDPDPATRAELQALIDNADSAELQRRFSQRLAFGTAGLRGVVGAGPNRMNRLVIQQTASGLGQYLLSQFADAKRRGVVIGYDGRPDSKTFAEDSARALMALGIKVQLTDTVAPTPLVAFGVLQLNAVAGIVVTASHNPPEYNGFKVYWENGAQIIPPHDAGIAAAIEVAAGAELPLLALEQGQQQGLLHYLGGSFYQEYQHRLLASSLLASDAEPQPLVIAYSAMHGVGARSVEAVMAQAGFQQLHSVAAQREPDGQFPTVKFPNPEEPGAMDLVIAEAQKVGALLACANDPDADRFAVAVRTEQGDYRMLSGDQVGALLGDYLLGRSQAQSALVGNTIVSSSLLGKIAAGYGAKHYQTLTGFKWLSNVGQSLENDQQRFLFAYEEALGYTVGSTVWDKDGISAMLAFCQMTAQLQAQGLTLWDKLASLYRQHGLHLNQQRSFALDANAAPIGDKLRQQPLTEIAAAKVVRHDDLKAQQTTFADGRTEAIALPASDVLIYHLDNGARVVVRPSGTEPKLKCYLEVVVELAHEETLARAEQRGETIMAEIAAAMAKLIAES